MLPLLNSSSLQTEDKISHGSCIYITCTMISYIAGILILKWKEAFERGHFAQGLKIMSCAGMKLVLNVR